MEEHRQRCYECFRPLSFCFCDAIPQIDNLTDVLILQHVGERFHPFNTARIVKKALRNCQLIVDHNHRLGTHNLPILANAGLLYPGENAPVLSDLSSDERPEQLIIIDGTWHQAKTIVRDVLQLHDLPCYRLAPTSPGQYRIRREPNAHSLSTLEATVGALHALEPSTTGLDQLLDAFDQMVQKQLGHPATHAVWREKKSRQTHPRNVPQAMLQNAENLVIAYGEATPGEHGRRNANSLPVNWVAQRLGTLERFSSLLQQEQSLSDAVMGHMRLSTEDFRAALSHDEFRRQWQQFLRPNDVLVVYHQKTSQLLRQAGAIQPRCLVLKSIFGNWHEGFRTLEELMAIEGVEIPMSENTSRADQRLDMAVAMVEHLRTKSGL